ncbi:MAG: hypothetical protein IPK50_08600 [Fibrobacterota bacterium]|nr:MAG: hypothetical protein IPK50_08600 [Fibrobacterota bacterium]
MPDENDLYEWFESQLLDALTDDFSVYLLLERHISYQRISCPNDPIYQMIRSEYREVPQISDEMSSKICGIVSSLLTDASKPLDLRLALLHSVRGAEDGRVYTAALEFYFKAWPDLPSGRLMSAFYDLEKFGFPKAEWKFESPEQYARLQREAYEVLQNDPLQRGNSFLVNEFFASLIPVYG